MMHSDKILTPLEVVWEMAVVAHTNVLYYQNRVALWTKWDTWMRLFAAFASSGAVALFLTSVDKRYAVGVGLAAALSSTIGATLRVPDKVRALGVLLAEYVTHANALERIHQFGGTDTEIKEALKALEQTEQREAKDHPLPNGKLLDKCHAIVEKRISPKPSAALLVVDRPAGAPSSVPASV